MILTHAHANEKPQCLVSFNKNYLSMALSKFTLGLLARSTVDQAKDHCGKHQKFFIPNEELQATRYDRYTVVTSS